uniref:50S ribosomal protein L20 n=2 Tax=Hemiselmis andersenii TaxID=464988 RepID=A0A7S0XXM4_HEMAN|mmetsp:Transcript_21201/g.48695  ORF Transcript_21201/g.48695 Transcript_21201/m.48695 type:complete len:126 (+) Transcript_21201:26-403(+)
MKREKVFSIVKGFRGRAKNCFRIAHQAAEKALQNQYYSRKLIKRDMRSLWITRINAAAREHGLKYCDLIHGLNLAQIDMNRKVLSELAVTEPASFAAVVDKAKGALMAKHAAEMAQKGLNAVRQQ